MCIIIKNIRGLILLCLHCTPQNGVAGDKSLMLHCQNLGDLPNNKQCIYYKDTLSLDWHYDREVVQSTRKQFGTS